MSRLVSSWAKQAQVVPENYIFPPEDRPGDDEVPICLSIPVIDLSQNTADTVQQIMKAAQEIGIFQVINHGVSEELMEETMVLFNEFFHMDVEEKAKIYSEDRTKSCRLYTSGRNYSEDETNCWRDALSHPCYPVEDHVQSWPEKPARYKEVVGKYSVEVRKLAMKILNLFCEGLGLDAGYFENERSEIQMLVANHCPRCPNPSLALGAGSHCDPNLLTILQQDLYGLQIMKDEKWVGVEPITHAFVIDVANQLEIISNGRLKSAHHRAVTNSGVDRTSIVNFTLPSRDCVIEPAKALVSESSPALFREVKFKEFTETYGSKKAKNGELANVVESLKVHV